MDSDSEDMIQVTDESGRIYWMEAKKPTKSRNKPGQAETAKRGSVANSQGFPNGAQRPRVCIRCGDPSRYVKDCPQPFRPALGPEFPSNFAKKLRW